MNGLVLSNEKLNELFPFHFVLDNSIKITQAGKSLIKICPDMVGAFFQEYFIFTRPAFEIQYSFDSISTYYNQVFILEVRQKKPTLHLRGQIVKIDNNILLFVGSPWIIDTDDFEKHNLLIKDFAIHDPVTDMVQLLSVKNLAFEDAENLMEDLKSQRDILVKKNLEIEDLAKFPAENPNPILRISLTGKLRYANNSAQEILNKLNLNLGDDLPAFMNESFASAIKQDKKIDTNLKVLNKEFNFLLVPFIDSGYVNIYGADITEKLQAENLLKESEEKYKQIVEEASDIIYRTDYRGNFTYANTTAERIMRMSKQELIDKHFTELVHPSWKEKTAQFYLNQFKQRIPVSYFEFLAVDSESKEVWLGQNVKLIAEGDKVIGFHAVARDVSDRIKAQMELQKNEEKYRGIIENLDLGILEVDNSGIIIKAYEKYCQLTGYSSEELVGKNANEFLLDNENREIIKKQITKREKGESSVYEVQINCKNNIKKWVLISGSSLFDENDNVVGSIGIHLDITERKESEQKLLLAKQAAEQSQKVKEDFLANMSHEIRTPMNGILGMSKLLSSANLTGKHKEYLSSINTSASNLLVIINDILDLSKIEAGKLKFEQIGFRVDKIIKNAIETVNYLAVEKDLFISTDIDDKINNVVFIGDPTRLNQVLTNLLSNAVKFTSHGEIELIARVLLLTNNKFDIKFSVIDTGIGIPKDKQQFIFESFNQVDTSTTRKFGGTGLGLAICKRLVEMQNGSIGFDSVENKGTTFYFNIPFAIGTENDIPHSEETIIDADLSTVKVLLVEDHRINQVYATSILEDHKINVDLAENGKEAIEMLKIKQYDIVLMDMQMPIMGGVEATQIIRKELQLTIPIIALTANAIAGESEKCINAGMNDFVSKPFKDIELINKIAKLLNRKANKVASNISKEESPIKNADPIEINNQPLYTLQKLNEMARGNNDFVKKMVQLFKDETPKAIKQLNEHLQAKEYDRIGAVAHKMKPSIAMMDMQSIKNDVQQIEENAKNMTNLEQIPVLIEKVTTICNKVISQL